jgi:hypothetical protein
MPHHTLKEILHTKGNTEIHRIVGGKLNLSMREAYVVCGELFEERDDGLWD